MTYNGRQGRYPEQYQARPQTYDQQYNEYNQPGYDNGAGHLTQHGQDWTRYQPDAYANNQQYNQSSAQHRGRHASHGQHYQNGPASHDGYIKPQQYEQPRQYQYDERFRAESRAAQQHADARSGRRSPQASRPGTSASSRRLKQERILNTLEEPKTLAWDNPFGVFPGTKKNVEQRKKEASQERSRSRADASVERPATSSLSIDAEYRQNTPSFDETRPQTSRERLPQSHQQSTFNQLMGPLDDMPLRKKVPAPQPQTEHSSFTSPQLTPSGHRAEVGLPLRPVPHRLEIGPSQGREPLPLNARFITPQAIDSNQKFDHQALPQYGHDAYTQPQELPAHITRDENNSALVSNDYGAPVELPTRRQAQSTDTRQDVPQRSLDNISYRGVVQTRPSRGTADAELPNFAAMTPGATESMEKEVAFQSKSATQPIATQVYPKPTYGDASSKLPRIRPGLASPPPKDQANNYVQSPVHQFDFGLPASTHSTVSPSTPMQTIPPVELDSGYAASFNRGESQHSSSQSARDHNQQFPPRDGSRIDTRAGRRAPAFNHPYNQPTRTQHSSQLQQAASANQRRRDPGYALLQDAPNQNYGHENEGYSQNYQPDNASQNFARDHSRHEIDELRQLQPLARTSTEPVNQRGSNHYNHGYDQRPTPETQNGYARNQYPADPYQYRAPTSRGSSQSFDQHGNAVPARPRTANSARPPARQYPDHSIPVARPSNPNLSMADRNHPIPFRPGLTDNNTLSSPSPTSAAPSQVSPPRATQTPVRAPQQATSPPRKDPVTIEMLNGLRLAFKDRSNDEQLGVKFAKRLVEASNVLASENGKADPKQTAKNRERYINDAYRIVKKLVANGSPEAMFYLADCYGQGQLGLEANAKEAFQLYTSAAKLGHASSAYRVAICCELGPDGGGGTRRDHAKAVQFYKRAATLGDGPAMFKIGMILLKGLLGQQPNRREGISWLKRAAERADAENPHALHELAVLYENAQSTDVIIRDERYALQLFTQAAGLGYKYSQYRLGSAYEYGTLGVQIDPRQSIAWYSRAAAQGEHQSEFALSGWYLTGSDPLLAQSDQEAYLWARKAASSGLAKAEYAMGYYTEVGIGCRGDIEEAKKWYFRAAAQSDSRAKERLEEIKRGGAKKEKTRISRSNVDKQNEGECAVM